MTCTRCNVSTTQYGAPLCNVCLPFDRAEKAEVRVAAAEALLVRAHGHIEIEGKSKVLVREIAGFLWPGQTLTKPCIFSTCEKMRAAESMFCEEHKSLTARQAENPKAVLASCAHRWTREGICLGCNVAVPRCVVCNMAFDLRPDRDGSGALVCVDGKACVARRLLQRSNEKRKSASDECSECKATDGYHEYACSGRPLDSGATCVTCGQPVGPSHADTPCGRRSREAAERLPSVVRFGSATKRAPWDLDNASSVEDAYRSGISWGLHHAKYHEDMSDLEPIRFCERVVEVVDQQATRAGWAKDVVSPNEVSSPTVDAIIMRYAQSFARGQGLAYAVPSIVKMHKQMIAEVSAVNVHPGDWDKTAIESHCAKCERCQVYKKMADDEALRHAERANVLERYIEEASFRE